MSSQDATATSTTVEVKKRPGRPRKKPLRPPMERSGAATAPKQADNVVEFIYNEPMIYKKVFTLFKAADAKELMFIFDKTEVRIITSDHLEKAHFMVVFDCSKLVHYYCAERTVATVNAEHIEKINQVLDKYNTMISIICKKVSVRESIVFVFQNEMKIDTIREVNLITPTIQHLSLPCDFETKEHEVSWEWPSTYLKKTVGDISIFTDTFTAIKNGAGRLVFHYKTEDCQIKIQNVVKDPALSRLVATTTEHDIFSVSVLIDYIKPVASAILAETIRVFADRRKKMIFASELDGGCINVRCAVNIVTAGVT